MSLTTAEVAHLADLARIELSEAELELMTGQLDIVLEAVAVVSAAVDDSIPPTTHALALSNVFRDDVVQPSLPAEAVLAMAPAVEQGRFRVPHILEDTV